MIDNYKISLNLFKSNSQKKKKIHTYIHTYIHIYIYIYICVCVSNTLISTIKVVWWNWFNQIFIYQFISIIIK